MSSSESEYLSDTQSDTDLTASEDDLDDIIENLEDLQIQPYQFEPEKDNATVTVNCETDKNEGTTEGENNENTAERIGNLVWCSCSQCSIEKREIDCLCCHEVSAVSEEQFDGKQCITFTDEFKTICLNKTVLKNVLVGMHETRGDHIEKETSNRSYRYAAYKQFVWWVFQRLGKGNRRVLPSCVIWKIRNCFEEEDGVYSLYSEGGKD